MQNKIYPELEWITIPHAKNKNATRKLLSKAFIEKAYIELELSRLSLCDHYGVSDKVFTMSYWYHYNVDERRAIGNRKIALAQRTKNSNRHNTGTPRVILDKDILLSMLEKRYALERMGRELAVAPQTVRANLEYHKIADMLVRGGVPYEIVLAAKAIDFLAGTNILEAAERFNLSPNKEEIEETLKQLVEANNTLTSLQNSLRVLRKRLYARAGNVGADASKYKLPTTKLNATCNKILVDLGYTPIVEFELEGKYYDFKLTDKVLLEIDSEIYHSSTEDIANDEVKNRIALDNGYKLLRVVVGKDKETTIKNKLIQCLNNLK